MGDKVSRPSSKRLFLSNRSRKNSYGKLSFFKGEEMKSFSSKMNTTLRQKFKASKAKYQSASHSPSGN